MTTPAAIFWLFAEPWWNLVLLSVYVGFAWACWENGSFLLTFDTIPEERRTPIMTVYQPGLAVVMTAGSLLGRSPCRCSEPWATSRPADRRRGRAWPAMRRSSC